MKRFAITRGLDLPVTGQPEQQIETAPPVQSVGVIGADYLGLRPTMLVAEGDQVTAGQPLFEDKKNPGVVITAPGTGRVRAINRGARRVLQSVVIDLAENRDEYERAALPAMQGLADASREAIVAALAGSGLWTSFRTRPFNRIPRLDARADAIFINAHDTNPLAADPAVVVGERMAAFTAGLRTVAALTDGPLYVCHGGSFKHELPAIERLQRAEFTGCHPAGLVGTHVHHLAPVGMARIVWHLNYQDCIAIGHLASTGELSTERVIALAGPLVERPRLLRTRLGANTEDLVRDQVQHLESRVISGSVFNGRAAHDWASYLGRYHLQISVLAEGRERELFGWIAPGGSKFSITNTLISSLNRARRFAFTTSQRGSPRAKVPISAYEKVMPLDILPTQLLRALLVKDTDAAQKLGCLELDEEDLALCSFVCPGKYEFGPVLRQNLEIIEKEG
ncbi:MAG: Na(+)-translocating NADH-quinone reductase subunit A [Gammaproteobacteria bacterium]|nr:Na(+)-translocating NADH-quinone reductase subunit A [Gammaproteobacteria bacterium]